MGSRTFFVSNRRTISFKKALAAISGFLFLVSTNPALADGALSSVPTAPPPSAQSMTPSVVPTAAAAAAAAIQQAGVAPGTQQMNLGATNANVALTQATAINVGGHVQFFNQGAMVTPAQFLAAQQALQAGRQALQVGSNGAASGGRFFLNSAAQSPLQGIVIPTNVTAIAVNAVAPIYGDLVNAGTIYGLATNAADPTVTIAARAILNQQSGLITTITPAAIQALVPGSLANANLVLAGVGEVVNKGVISSSQNLTVASTTAGVHNAGMMSAQQTLNLITGNGVINNAGLIVAGANANIDSNNSTSITVNSSGTIQAQNINIAAVNKDINLNGGNYLSSTLNLNAGTGAITGVVGNVTGQLNSNAGVINFWADAPTLTLGNNCVTGDPTFASTGNIQINGLNTFGEDVAILAGGNITADANAKIVAPGFNVTLVAGAGITINGGGSSTNQVDNTINSIDITGGNGTGVPPYGAGPTPGATVDVDFTTGNGGHIDLSTSTQVTVIDTSSPTNGGNVTLAAISGGGGQGYVKVNTGSTIDTRGFNGDGGDLRVFADGVDGASNGIVLGNVRTSGTVDSGTVQISATAPQASIGTTVTYDANGQITSGNTIIGGADITANPAATVSWGTIDTSGIGGAGSTTGGVNGQNGGNAGLVSIAGGHLVGGDINAYGGGGGGGSSDVAFAGSNGGNGGDGASVTLTGTGPTSTSIIGKVNTSGGGGGGGAGGSNDGLSTTAPGTGGVGGLAGTINLGVGGAIQTGNLQAADGGAGGAGGNATGSGVAASAGAGGGGGGSLGGGGGGGASGVNSGGLALLISGGGAGGAGIFGGGGGAGNQAGVPLTVDGGSGGGASTGGNGGTSPVAGLPGSANTGGNGGNATGGLGLGGTMRGIGGIRGFSSTSGGTDGQNISSGAATIDVFAANGLASVGTAVSGRTYGSLVTIDAGGANGAIFYQGTIVGTTAVQLGAGLSAVGNIGTASGSLISTPALQLLTNTGTIGTGAIPIVTDANVLNVQGNDGSSAYIRDNALGTVRLQGTNTVGSLPGNTFSLSVPSATVELQGGDSLAGNTIGIQTSAINNDGTVSAANLAIDTPTGSLTLTGSGAFNSSNSLQVSSAGPLNIASDGIGFFQRFNTGNSHLTFVSGDSITASGDGVIQTITTGLSPAADSGNVNLYAGFNYTYDFAAPTALAIGAASANGGSVVFTGDTPINIDTRNFGTSQDAGDINIFTSKGSVNPGQVLFLPSSTINVSGNIVEGGTGTNGSIFIQAGSTNSTAVQLGNIFSGQNFGSFAQTTNNSGAILIRSATPTGSTTVTNGVQGAALGGILTANGGIVLGNIDAYGSSVDIQGGGGITAGHIETSGAGGTTGAGGNAGAITLSTTSGINSITVGYLRAYGGGGAGGANDGGAGGDILLTSKGNITVNGDINSSGGGGGGAQIGNTAGDGGNAGLISISTLSGNVSILGPVLSSGGAGGGGSTATVGGGGGGSMGGGGGGADGGAGGGGFYGGGGSNGGSIGAGGGVFGGGTGVGATATDGQNGAGGNGDSGFDGGLFGVSGEGGNGGTPAIVGDTGADGGGSGGNAGGFVNNSNSLTIQNTIYSAGSSGIPGYNYASIGNSGFGLEGISSYGLGVAAINLATAGALTIGFSIGAPALASFFSAGIFNIIGLATLFSLGTVNIDTDKLTNEGTIVSFIGNTNITGLQNQGSLGPLANPNVDNSGVIASLTGDVNISSDVGQNLIIAGGGTMSVDSPTASINLTATDNGGGTATNYLILAGDQTFVGDTNMIASGQNQTLWVQPGINVAGTDTVTLNASNLILDSSITANPLVITTSGPGLNITNTTGDLVLPNNLVFNGKSLFLGSVGSIIGGGLTQIDLSDTTGNGGSLTMVAGFNITNANGTVTIGTPNAGGSIVLPDVVINTSSTAAGGAGGSVTAIARNGNIELQNVLTQNTTANGVGGDVVLFGNGVKVDSIDALGELATGHGDVLVRSGTSGTTGGVITYNQGIKGGTGVYVNSGNSGNIQFNGIVNAGNVTLVTGGTGSITQTAGNINANELSLTAGTGGVASFVSPLQVNSSILSVETTGNAYINLDATVTSLSLLSGKAQQLQIVSNALNGTINVDGNINSDNLLLSTNDGSINVTFDISGIDGINGANADSLHFVTDNFHVTSGTTVKGALITVDSAGGTNLVYNNEGIVQADLGQINVNASSSGSITILGGGLTWADQGTVDFTAGFGGEIHFTGDQTFGGDTNLNATSPISQIRFDDNLIVNGLNALNLNTNNLVLSNGLDLTGNPLRFNSTANLGTIANSNGDVNIPTGLIFHGESLAIIASGNVNSGSGVSIDLSSTSGNGGTLTIFAGYNFTLGTNGQVGPDGTVYYIGNPSASGGSVNMSGADITTKSTVGNGGNILVLAHEGVVNNGSISLGNLDSSSGAGNAGSITLFGRGGISTQDIKTDSSLANPGAVNIVAGTPTIIDNSTSGGVQIWNGEVNPSYTAPLGLLAPSYTATPDANSGNILVGNISARSGAGTTTVTLVTNGAGSVNGRAGTKIDAFNLVAVAGTGGIGTLANPLSLNVNNVTLSAQDLTGASPLATSRGDVVATNSLTSNLVHAAVPSFVNTSNMGSVSNFLLTGDYFQLISTGPASSIVLAYGGTPMVTNDLNLHASGFGSITRTLGEILVTKNAVFSTEGGNIGNPLNGLVLDGTTGLQFNAGATGDVEISVNNATTELGGSNTGNNVHLFIVDGGLVFADGANLNANTRANIEVDTSVTQVGTNRTIDTPNLRIVTNSGNIGDSTQPLVVSTDVLLTKSGTILSPADTFLLNQGAPSLQLLDSFARDYSLESPGTNIFCTGCLVATTRHLNIDTGTTGSLQITGAAPGTGLLDVDGDVTITTGLIINNPTGLLTGIGALGNVTLNAATFIDSSSFITAGGVLTINAESLITSGTITSIGNMNINLSKNWNNSGSVSAGSLIIPLVDSDVIANVGSLDNSGSIEATQDINITATQNPPIGATGIIANGGTGSISAGRNATLKTVIVDANGLPFGLSLTNAGTIQTTNGFIDIDTQTGSMLNGASPLGVITAGTTTTIKTNNLSNGGHIFGTTNISITTLGDVVNEDNVAQIQVSNGNMQIDAGGNVENIGGVVSASGSIAIDAVGDVKNTIGLLPSATPNLTAGTTLDIDANSILNETTMQSGTAMTLTTPMTSASNFITNASGASLLSTGGSVTATTHTFTNNETTSSGTGYAIHAKVVNQNNSLTAGNQLTIDGGISGLDINPADTVAFNNATTTVTTGSAFISTNLLNSQNSVLNVLNGNLTVDGGFAGGVLRASNITFGGAANQTLVGGGGDITLLTQTATINGIVTASGAGADILLDATGDVTVGVNTMTADSNITFLGDDYTTSGTITATNAAVGIDVNSLSNSADISAGTTLTANATTTIDNSGSLTSIDDLSLTAGTSVINSGLIQAGTINSTSAGNLSITTDVLTNDPTGEILSNGNLTINKGVSGIVVTPLTNVQNGGLIRAGNPLHTPALTLGHLEIAVVDLTNTGTLAATGNVFINGGTSTLLSPDPSANIDSQNGTINAGGNVTLTGDVIKLLNVDAGGNLNATSSLGGITTFATSFNTYAGGTVHADGSILVGATTIDIQGTLDTDDDMLLDSSTTGSITVGATGVVDALGDAEFNSKTVDNSGSILVGGSLTAEAVDSFTNAATGSILTGNLSLDTADLTNNGDISSVGYLFAFLNNSTGVKGDDSGAASITAGGSLSVITTGDNDIHILNQQIQAGGGGTGGVHGANVLLLAGGNIFNATSDTVIDTSSTTGDAGSITLFAGGGTNITQTGVNSVELTSGANGNGYIDLGTSANDLIATLDASSTAGNGGNVTLVAYSQLGGSGSGYISMSPTDPGVTSLNSINTAGTAQNGSVVVAAGGLNPTPVEYKNLIPITGSAITVGNINTEGAVGSDAASINVYASNPVATGSTLSFSNGTTADLSVPSTLTTGSIVTGTLTTNNGDGSIADNANAAITVKTNGDINFGIGTHSHNLTFHANNGILTLPENELVASVDDLGNGGLIDITGGALVYLQGNLAPLTLTANGTTGNAGEVRVVRNNTSLLVIGDAPNDLLINATGALNAGKISVINGGQLFVVLTAVPGPTGAGRGLNFTGTNGDGAQITLIAGNMVPGILTLNGPLNVDATSANGVGGSVTLGSNSTTSFNYGNKTAGNTNGVQGTITVSGNGTGAHGNITIFNNGGGVVYAPTAADAFDEVNDVSLSGTVNSGKTAVALQVNQIITAQGKVTLESNATGTSAANALINITKAVTAGGDIEIRGNAINGTSTLTTSTTGTLNGDNIIIDNNGVKGAVVTLGGTLTTNGSSLGDIVIGNFATNGAGTVKATANMDANGSNADVVIDNQANTTGSIAVKGITADDAIVLLNTTKSTGSIANTGALNAGSTVVMHNDLVNTTGTPTGTITVGSAITAANNVVLLSTGNGKGMITVNANTTATNGDVVIEQNGATGTIVTGGAATISALNGDLLIEADGNVGSGTGLSVNAPNLAVNSLGNSLGTVIINDKNTGTVNLADSSAGKTFTLTTPAELITQMIDAPLGVTLKSTGNGKNITVGYLNTNASTSGATKGGIVNITTTGVGDIRTTGTGILAETINLTTGSNAFVEVDINATNLAVNAPGNGDVVIGNTRSTQLNVTKAVHTAGDFLLTSEGTINFKSALASNGTTVLTTTAGSGSDILLGAAIGTKTTGVSITLDADGDITGKGKLTSAQVNLTAGGDIGGSTAATAINVVTPDLATAQAGGSFNVKDTFTNTVTLDPNASAGTSFTLNTGAGLTVTSVTANDGNISLIAAKGNLLVLPDATIQAFEGSILLQNTAGTIQFGNRALGVDNNISVLTTVTGKDPLTSMNPGSIKVVIGKPPAAPIAGPFPDDVLVAPVGSGVVSFGKNGIKVVGVSNPPSDPFIATFTAINTQLTFSTGSKPATSITVNQGVRFVADPPAPATAPSAATVLSVPSINVDMPAKPITPVNNSQISAAPASLTSGKTESAQQLSYNFAPLTNLSAATMAQIAAMSAPRTANDFATETELMTGEIPATLASDEGITVDTRVRGNATLTGGVARNIGNGKVVGLNKGSVVFAPKVDTVVQTGYGDIHIAANSVVLVLSFNGGVGVYNLHDTKRGAVAIDSGSRNIVAAPGETVVLTSTTRSSFDEINPAQLFLYRNVRAHQVGTLKAFVGEFSPMSAINAVLPLKQLCGSKQPQARRLADNLLKTAAIVYQVRAANGQYQQILRPSLAAWVH